MAWPDLVLGARGGERQRQADQSRPGAIGETATPGLLAEYPIKAAPVPLVHVQPVQREQLPRPLDGQPPGLPGDEQEGISMIEAGWELRSADPVPFSRFTDGDVDPDVRYAYAVEAVDRADNLSAVLVVEESGDTER